MEKHSIALRRAEPPRPVRISKIQPNSNTIELNVQTSSDHSDIPLLQYIVKCEQVDVPNSLKTISFPGIKKFD